MSNIKIELDNQTTICHPGETISGQLKCFFNSEVKTKAIRIRFKGRAKVRWTTTSYATKRRRTTHYMGDELYFLQDVNVFEPPPNESTVTIQPGDYTFPFSYNLPAGIPGSFEGTYGTIRYSIKGTVIRPWHIDYDTFMVLTLISPLDLNSFPLCRNPVTQAREKVLSCCCCKSGTIDFSVHLLKTGYIPGQVVEIGAHVLNMSNSNVTSVKFGIIKHTEFVSQEPSSRTKQQKEYIARAEDGAVGAHSDKTWTRTISIPREDFRNTHACSIINIRYILKATAVTSTLYSNFSIEIPITIGSVAIADGGTAPSAPLDGAGDGFAYATAPPSYEEAVEGQF